MFLLFLFFFGDIRVREEERISHTASLDTRAIDHKSIFSILKEILVVSPIVVVTKIDLIKTNLDSIKRELKKVVPGDNIFFIQNVTNNHVQPDQNTIQTVDDILTKIVADLSAKNRDIIDGVELEICEMKNNEERSIIIINIPSIEMKLKNLRELLIRVPQVKQGFWFVQIKVNSGKTKIITILSIQEENYTIKHLNALENQSLTQTEVKEAKIYIQYS